MSDSLNKAFQNPAPSARLNAALMAGLKPSPHDLETLIERCAIEPDFQVREMLTWALIRLPAEIVVPQLIEELANGIPQARIQALHTLSKFRDKSAWRAVAACLDDEDRNVVRTAWYAAVALVPDDDRTWLANRLAEHLGQGEKERQRSLSRALIGLGEDVISPILTLATRHENEAIRQHGAATERLLRDPDTGFSHSLDRAKREVAMGRTRSAKG